MSGKWQPPEHPGSLCPAWQGQLAQDCPPQTDETSRSPLSSLSCLVWVLCYWSLACLQPDRSRNGFIWTIQNRPNGADGLTWWGKRRTKDTAGTRDGEGVEEQRCRCLRVMPMLNHLWALISDMPGPHLWFLGRILGKSTFWNYCLRHRYNPKWRGTGSRNLGVSGVTSVVLSWDWQCGAGGSSREREWMGKTLTQV